MALSPLAECDARSAAKLDYGLQVPASRRRQVLRYWFKVAGISSVDPGQTHCMGGDGIVTNAIALPAIPAHGHTAVAVRETARAALEAVLRGRSAA